MESVGIKLAWTVWLFRKKIENFSSGAHILYTNWNLVNSRRFQDEDGKETHQNAKTRVQGMQRYCFCSLSPLPIVFFGIPVAIIIVFAQAPLKIKRWTQSVPLHQSINYIYLQPKS